MLGISTCIHWRKLALFWCITIFVITREFVASESIDPKIKESINKFILNTYLPANNHPALGLAITSGNESLLYTTGYGLMDVANERPTTNETEFLIGSISKSFTAVIVCKTLHEKFPELGSKALDTPIRQLIPEFNFTLNDRYRSEATTFRDMLSHRVCSKTDGIAILMIPFKDGHEVAYRQRYAEEKCNFRTSFVYNNGMYALASAVLESIAGRSYESLITDLLRDLEMHNTTIVKESDDDQPVNRAVPYYFRNGERHNYNPKLMKRVTFASAAGGVVSNAVDMRKYLQFHMNKGKVGDRQVVPEKVMEWLYQVAMHYPTSPESYESDIGIGYGLGLSVGFSDGWCTIGHGGSVPPFISEMSFYPGKDIGIFTVTNQGPENSTMIHPHLHRAIFDILRGVDPTKAINERKGTNSNKKNNKPVSVAESKTRSVEDKEKYIGSYGNGLQGEIEITIKPRNETNTTELYMNYGQWGQAFLLGTETDMKFNLYWDSDVVQDKYFFGRSPNDTFGYFSENITEFHFADRSRGVPTGKFKKGLSLGILPPVPWTPESCGPESKHSAVSLILPSIELQLISITFLRLLLYVLNQC